MSIEQLAFPCGDMTGYPAHSGMTLRDYFAAVALAALLPQSNARCLSDLDWADRAYQVADGMLEARERSQTNDR